MTRTSTELVRLDSLQSHPENAKLYDDSNRKEEDLQALQESVRTHGLWEGFLQVHPSGVILDGHRRVRIAMELGITEAVVTKQLHLPDDVNDWHVLRFLLDGNTHRIKSVEEKLREFEMRKVIETAAAKERQVEANTTRHSRGVHMDTTGSRGKARDLAAQAAGLGSGSKAEEGLKALHIADELQDTMPEKAAAIKAALNQSMGAGVKAARQAVAQPPAVAQSLTAASTATTPPATTMRLTNSSASIAKASNVLDGKRHRSMAKCRAMKEFAIELEYLQAEMPKVLKALHAAELKVRKLGDRYTEQFVQDRYNPDFITVWAQAWKEDGSFDLLKNLDDMRREISLIQGGFTALPRLMQTDEIMVDP